MTPAIVVEFDVPARMRDGTILRANVYRPSGEGRWPVLLTRLPYGKDLPIGSAVLDPAQAARRGYVVIVQDTRGRFTSEGEWDPMRHEAEDGGDAIGWAAGLPCSNGQVGMYGASYMGFTQWAAATERPSALRAIAPVLTWSDARDGAALRGGALELGTAAHWQLLMGLDVLTRRHAADRSTLGRAIAALARELDALGSTGYASLPLSEFAPLRSQDVGPAFFDAFHPRAAAAREAFMSISQRRERVEAPSLNVGGWYDIFLNGTLDNFRAMRRRGVPAKLLIGPWSHASQGSPVGEVNFGFASQAAFIDLRTDLVSLQLRWFDHWLRGVDTGMLGEPPIALFVMGANVWRDEQEWPLARAVETPYYLRANRRLSPEPPQEEPADAYDYDPADPVPTRGGATLMSPEYRSGPVDQRPIEVRDDVLVYTSAVLERDLEVTGPVHVLLWACSSAPDTDFVARLVDVHPDGSSLPLTDGIIRARFREAPSGAAPSLLEPGRAYPFEIDLWATSNVFRAGHRIRLHVTSSSFPRWDRNPNTGHDAGADAALAVARQTILHDRSYPSHVVLPIIPA